jgi:hypothetical protein
VARSGGSRCSEPSPIARRSFVWRQQDPVEDVPIVLKEKKRCNHVREPCGSKREEGVQSRDRDEVGAHCRSAVFPFTSGGAVVLDQGGLAAMS